MARYAVISSNVIVNLVEWDGGPGWAAPDGHSVALAPMPCSVGWLWNNGAPLNPNPAPTPPIPVMPDLSNLDNLDKTLKSIALLLRDYCNALQAGTYTQKTVNQLKSDFLAKYNSLS